MTLAFIMCISAAIVVVYGIIMWIDHLWMRNVPRDLLVPEPVPFDFFINLSESYT